MPRAKRNFYITIRQNDGGTSEKKAEPAREKKKTKFSRVEKPVSSFIDDLATLVKQKVGHWALVIEADPGNNQGKRVFEICTTDHGVDPDSGTEDRYESDDDYPEIVAPPNDKKRIEKGFKELNLRAKAEPRDGHEYGEPNYETLGGVFWDILSRLKSHTKLTNSEIKHEAQRIWKRQQNYRLLDNNCQRFCILLAISIRAKQNTTLRLLNAKIVKKQAGKTEKAVGKAVSMFK